MVHALAASAEARGTDASGIAYHSGGKLCVYKRPLPGHLLPLRIPNDTAVVMGHTRMTTKGDGKRNYNNHPFHAKAGGTAFALAHNGVIHNDQALRQSLKLPQTKIETDSYIAVQLLQRKDALDFDSLRYMAEQVEGSFSFTVLDDRDHLHFVKGDSPLCIFHYPELGLYLYASTSEILMDALTRIPHHFGEYERVDIDGGELLMIGPDGSQQRSSFRFVDPMSYYGLGYWGWGCCLVYRESRGDYTRALKSVAGAFGITPWQIDQLLEEGFTHEEIEDCLYCGEL